LSEILRSLRVHLDTCSGKRAHTATQHQLLIVGELVVDAERIDIAQFIHGEISHHRPQWHERCRERVELAGNGRREESSAKSEELRQRVDAGDRYWPARPDKRRVTNGRGVDRGGAQEGGLRRGHRGNEGSRRQLRTHCGVHKAGQIGRGRQSEVIRADIVEAALMAVGAFISKEPVGLVLPYWASGCEPVLGASVGRLVRVAERIGGLYIAVPQVSKGAAVELVCA
jgi:hypothetical protein